MEISEGVYTLLGVGLGAALTQVSAWLGIRQTDQRTKREALYFLLELRRLLSVLERWNRVLPHYLDRMHELVPPSSPDVDAALHQKIERWLRAMPVPLIGAQLAALKVGYEAGLLKLAAIDPIGAYRLRGMDELLARLPQLLETVRTTFASQLDANPLALEEMNELTDFARQHLEVDGTTEALKLVHSVVEELVKQLDRGTRRKWAAELAREWEQEIKMRAKLDNYLEKVRTAFSPDER